MNPGAPSAVDAGLWSLLAIAALHGVAADEAQLRHTHGEGAFDRAALLLAARSLGLHARTVRQDPARLAQAPLPAIACDTEGRHFVVARLGPDGRVLVQRAGELPALWTLEQLQAVWTGELVYVTSKASWAGALAKFDFSWFIPAIVKYRGILAEVLLVSLVLQLIGLATPLFFQVVMDKVLVNQALTTLNVIAIGLLGATLFEALLSGIRSWVFAHTSSKIDVELGARLFRHLLALPLAYFQARRVGDSVARVRELESIRSFLTGNVLTLVMDLLFSGVFIAVMFWYSVPLTLIVLGSIPVYVLLSLLFTPLIRRRLEEKFNRGAENQSFLVETVSGIDTVKALAVEPRWTQKWDQQLAGYVSASLAVTRVATLAGGGVQLVSKLVTVALLWFGARLVIVGH